jgi:hypothetical protein
MELKVPQPTSIKRLPKPKCMYIIATPHNVTRMIQVCYDSNKIIIYNDLVKKKTRYKLCKEE